MPLKPLISPGFTVGVNCPGNFFLPAPHCPVGLAIAPTVPAGPPKVPKALAALPRKALGNGGATGLVVIPPAGDLGCLDLPYGLVEGGIGPNGVISPIGLVPPLTGSGYPLSGSERGGRGRGFLSGSGSRGPLPGGGAKGGFTPTGGIGSGVIGLIGLKAPPTAPEINPPTGAVVSNGLAALFLTLALC
jgi:hypothetical protein